jgi:predicted DNA binding CopG/RHH family protein
VRVASFKSGTFFDLPLTLTVLKTGISAGQAVANVRLVTLEPKLRNNIRLSAEALHAVEQEVSYQSLVYELERIYTYLATELGNPAAKGYVPLQDRLNVAEYGLLEGQVESCSRELNAKGVLDADILAVIAEQMTDFKRRLGIDYYVTGLTYDREAIQTWLNDLLRQTKSGLMFYVKGCRLFWNDILYCSSLIARAAQGYTLKPREVRTIRYVLSVDSDKVF